MSYKQPGKEQPHEQDPRPGAHHWLGAELLPDVRLLHILDEPLLERVRQRGQLAPEDGRRIAEHTAIAKEVGAAAVLVTCSTISPCVDEARRLASIPVVKIDDAMIAQAVATGNRIAVVATNRTTLEPTRQALEAEAARTGRSVQVALTLVEGAIDALMAGDGATHDGLIRTAVLKVAGQAQVVVLAQASMARALDVIPTEDCPVPVLSSPHLALQEVERILAGDR